MRPVRPGAWKSSPCLSRWHPVLPETWLRTTVVGTHWHPGQPAERSWCPPCPLQSRHLVRGGAPMGEDASCIFPSCLQRGHCGPRAGRRGGQRETQPPPAFLPKARLLSAERTGPTRTLAVIGAAAWAKHPHAWLSGTPGLQFRVRARTWGEGHPGDPRTGAVVSAHPRPTHSREPSMEHISRLRGLPP